MKRFVGMYLMQSNGRHTRISVLSETIRQHLQHRLTSLRISVDINLSELAIRSDIIHSPHVVVVTVGN